MKEIWLRKDLFTCPSIPLLEHHCEERESIAQTWSALSSLQAAAIQTPVCLNSAHPSHSGALIWVFSTLTLCFLVKPEIQHPDYLSKRALKLACIRQQKYMLRGNGQIHCHISLLSLCNQTVSWREDLHFNHYLMTHLHVSTCC